MSQPLIGTITHWQRFSTEDGPGIRTTVFFKGCPLRCRWCHNPECILPSRQLQWLEKRCIGCELCVKACPNHVLDLTESGMIINRQHCTLCGSCVRECPSGAMEMLGKSFSVEQLHELVKDRAYYEASGGGVTLSGGEPLIQCDFVVDLLKQLKQAGICTAIDTCGLVQREAFDRMLDYTDLILYDLKEIDLEKHREFTGSDCKLIYQNLLYLADLLRRTDGSKGLWIRTPLIPGDTADESTIRGIGSFLKQHLNGLVKRWELCAFNNLCADKYRRLEMAWAYVDTPLIDQKELARFEQCARESVDDPEIVCVTGMTKD